MKLKEITITAGGDSADFPAGPPAVTVGQANTLMGIKRDRLILRAQEELQAMKTAGAAEISADFFALRLYVYPSAMAAVISHENIPNWPAGGDLPFAEFCQLPDEFFTRWDRAVFDLNPHWFATVKKNN